MDKRRINLDLPVHLWDALRLAAFRRRITKTAWLVEAITEKLDRDVA